MRRIKVSTLLAFVLVVSSTECGAPADCPCDTTICSCDGKPPPKVNPNTTPVMEIDEHVCAADEAKLSATHELVIPCNRTCRDYWCMEKCRCVDRSEWEAWDPALHEPSTSTARREASPQQEPAKPASRKKTTPKKERPVSPDLDDPFGDGPDPVDKYLDDAAE